ncbi:hypothetical protein [Pseudomonas sp. Irchel 3A7]|uniref:hypothetical protein n=1 Tax=Pseudomonas sp. Irchel 3A7 TaxID=2008913 RepID=UPI001140086D|nr:hypothetical protein [Pseudomonas sp. Irchel 3A7]
MEFPAFGDADAYATLGQSCADFIVNLGSTASSCYNGVRPVGILVYQAIPYLLTNDPLALNYITLLLNLTCLLMLVTAVLFLFRNLNNSTPGQRRRIDIIGETAVVIFTLIICIGYIPVRLSDIQSLAFFIASLSILSNEKNRAKTIPLIIAGLLAGTSVLLKQNYVVSIFFLVIFWVAFDLKNQTTNKFKHIFLFLAGTSVCLIQVAMAYHHAGVLWFYEPKIMALYDPSNIQPYVELVAYTDPAHSVYLTQLPTPVSKLEFTAVKFYEGFAKFYWSVYLDKPPFDISPYILVFSKIQLIFLQLLLAGMFLAALATSLFKNKWITVTSLVAVSSGLLTAAIMHTENRYYVMTKLLCFIVVAVVLVNWIKKIRPRQNA